MEMCGGAEPRGAESSNHTHFISVAICIIEVGLCHTPQSTPELTQQTRQSRCRVKQSHALHQRRDLYHRGRFVPHSPKHSGTNTTNTSVEVQSQAITRTSSASRSALLRPVCATHPKHSDLTQQTRQARCRVKQSHALR
ncbi:hypothetical protein J6590_078101 [Homalodisca vitripennis]|nr:hypothetical protein J6590_078101 [Homalodisca vitripennis]